MSGYQPSFYSFDHEVFNSLHRIYFTFTFILLEFGLVYGGVQARDGTNDGDALFIFSIIFGWAVSLMFGGLLSALFARIHMVIAKRINEFKRKRAWKKDYLNRFIEECRHD